MTGVNTQQVSQEQSLLLSAVCLSFPTKVMIIAREEKLLKLAVYQSVLLGKEEHATQTEQPLY